jgi:phosphatidylglycerol---prolipoprotein diacylglyceryl transferase
MASRISPLGLLCCSLYGAQNFRGKALILEALANAPSAIHFKDLGLSPIVFEIGWFKLRWYSLAYIFGILLGWWQLVKMLGQPGAPMAKRHADDFIFYATLGIILGGRLGYALFYHPELLTNPLDFVRLWEGGMSFHGGVIGVVIAISYMCWKNGLNWLRLHDYIAVVYPLGHFLGRLANFVNGELWGKETTQPWGMVFPQGGEIVRHPSQLYEAGLEGLLLAAIMWWMFWKTDARYYPGRLVGIFSVAMGAFRFYVETFREPDVGVTGLLGMSMGQTLCIPLILVGLYCIVTSKRRRQRVEPAVGTTSVA